MASNFCISVHRHGNDLYVKLTGDFDGTSACELLNVLKEQCNSGDRVIVQTGGVKAIYPFGQDTFQNNLYTVKKKHIRMVFTGKNARQIQPERRKLFLPASGRILSTSEM